jgi:serine/threonine protein kinase
MVERIPVSGTDQENQPHASGASPTATNTDWNSGTWSEQTPMPAWDREGSASAAPVESSPSIPQDPLVGTLVGHYRLKDRLGQGSTGTVYCAEDLWLGRDVALKLALSEIPQEGNAVARQFLLEARGASRIDHPCCLPVFGVGKEQNQVYVTMPLCQQGSALDVLRSRGAFNPLDATRICKLAARGLAAAHAASIGHGHVRAHKILLGDRGAVRLADFRLVKAGSADDNPPERGASPAAVAADLEALSLTFYYLLTASDPFADGATALPEKTTLDLCGGDGDIASACAHLIDRGRASGTARRFETAAQLADAFEDLERRLRTMSSRAPAKRAAPAEAAEATLPSRSRSTAPASSPIGIGTVLGKYLLIKKVGQGSAGQVFRALHQTLHIPVAVKILPRKGLVSDNTVYRQLQSEALLLAKLNHPNIIRVLDFESEGEYPYLVMEYIEGDSLAELIAREGRLRPERALEIISQVAEGLADASKRGLVHRDVKPANILLGKNGNAKLADLGLAKVVSATSAPASNTSGGYTTAGTAAYMAPEQVLGTPPVDHRSDIYALGTSLYQALTGQLPFQGRSCREVMLKQVHEQAVPPHEVATELNPEISAVVLTMMAKDQGQRYQSYDDLLRALSALQAKLRAQTEESAANSSTTVAPGSSTETTLQGHHAKVTTLAFSPDGAVLATGSEDLTVKLWEVDTGKEHTSLRVFAREITAVAFAPDSKTLATASGDGTIKLWDMERVKVRASLTMGANCPVTTVVFTPDGQTLASANALGVIQLWDPSSGEKKTTMPGYPQPITALAYAPDGRTLASASGDNTVKLWDVAAAQVRLILRGHRFGVSSVCFSSDGLTLASASWDMTIKLWNPVDGAEQAALEGHTASVRSIAFAPLGRLLASASWDKTIKLWNLSEGKALTTFQGHSREVNAVVFSPQGNRLASASDDTTAKIWDLDHL